MCQVEWTNDLMSLNTAVPSLGYQNNAIHGSSFRKSHSAKFCKQLKKIYGSKHSVTKSDCFVQAH